MSFDKNTRNLLARMVAACRRRLIEDVTDQLRGVFGLHPDGMVLPLDKLTHLSPDQNSAARRLRDLLDHYTVGAAGKDSDRRKAAYERMVLEIAFTVLNRLAALRLCEERGLVIECVRKGTTSAGFQMFERISGGALGGRYDTYRVFLECMFDELAGDLGVLFDRMTPQSAVFPSERCMEDVLAELNKPELTHLWTEDETIGWVYQYFNPPEERKAMREASSAPRNGRELAVRNQFFTPRYVVEFLTDNTLGRIWYEMRKGRTALKDECRYLVRRPNEIFLAPGEQAPPSQDSDADLSQEDLLKQPVYIEHRPFKDPRELRILDPACGSGHFLLYAFDLLERIYEEAWLDPQLGPPLWEAVGFSPQVDTSKSDEAVDPASVKLRSDARPVGEGDCCDLYDCYVVLADLYDAPFLAGRPLVYSGAMCEETKDRILLKIPVAEFSYQEAIEKGWFANETGAVFLDLHKELFTWRMGGPRAGMFEMLDQATQDAHLALVRRAVPKMIVEHNLHGIDIDPRAVQIAALALWLRAQKTWKSLGLKAPERPQIAKSNIVTAEPMPGEADMKDEFAASLKPRVLGQIVDVVFEKMKLAGEAGSLLKIEEEIKDAVAEAREQWLEGPKMEQGLLFPDIETRQVQQLEMKFDVSGVTDEGFWEQAEDRILDALRDYAEQAEYGHEARRRLFADDAARGFAFIDLCRKRYDTVLMNPPFGEASELILPLLKSFASFSDNIAAPFAERFLTKSTFVAMVLDRALLIRKTHESFRRLFLSKGTNRLCGFANYGWGVLDANVEVGALIGGHVNSDASFFLDKKDDSELLKWLPTKIFTVLPNLVISADVPDFVANAFAAVGRLGESQSAARVGHQWKSERYLRLWWEGSLLGPFVYNGAPFSPYVFVTRNRVLRDPASMEVQCEFSTVLRNEDYHYLPGVAYGKRGIHLDAHPLPSKHTFTVEGLSCFPSNEQERYLLLAYLNSLPVSALLSLYCGQHKHVGYLNCLPYSNRWKLNPFTVNLLKSYINDKRKLLSSDETSPLFVTFIEDELHASGLHTGFRHFSGSLERASRLFEELHASVCNEVCNWLRFPDDWESAHGLKETVETFPKHNPTDIFEESGYESLVAFGGRFIIELIGFVFGRWDVRIAIDASLVPKLPDPFDPLPLCPPGMLVGPDGLPAEANRIVSEKWLRTRPDTNTLPPEGSVKTSTIPDSDYPLRISWEGVLVDDPGFNGDHPHRDDIVRRVREVFDLLWKDKAHEIEQEACEILGVSDLRDYFHKPSGFFQDHLKRYSKSRRKAPIYWPLSTASGSYTIWVYYQRLTGQTLYTAINKYVEPKISEIERGLARIEAELIATSGGEATRLRDRLNETRTFLGELRELREELLRIAALPYNPNLNDGVIINAAPFHDLFRLRAWANDTEGCWEMLKKGDYDWSHLAYTIWPDRVREVCKTDRSIAIAHGLEDLCEIESPKPKDKRGRKKKAEVE